MSIRLIVCVAIFTLGFSTYHLSAEAKDKQAATKKAPTHYWYEASGLKRPLVLADDLMVVKGDGHQRLQRVESGASASAQSGAGLQVFQSGREKLALPGGVIVKFRPGVSLEQVNDWMLGKGFESYRALVDTHTFLIATSPGIAALELANDLHESGELEYAAPNWWRQKSKR